MKKRFVNRLLGIGTVCAMAFTGIFGQMTSITALAEGNLSEASPEGENGGTDEGEAKDTGSLGSKQEDEQEGIAKDTLKKTPAVEEEVEKPESKEGDEGKESGKKAPEYEKESKESDTYGEEDMTALPEVTSVVVNTEVMKVGQYPVSMVVELDKAMAEDIELGAENISIKANKTGWLSPGISERDITVDVESVSFNEERNQITIVPGAFPDRYYYVPEYTVTCTYDDKELFSFTKDATKTVTPVADDFEARNDNGISYNLYSPDAETAVPAVIVFHGFGDDENLYANRIAVTWAEKNNQAARPAYVIAPKFGGYSYMSGAARNAVYEGTKAVVDGLVAEGKVDPGRIYVTGKSFGGAAVMEFNELYPDYAAASISMAPAVAYTDYFGNVTDQENLKKIKDNNIYIAQCDQDTTAPYAGTVQMYNTLQELGAKDILFTTYSLDELNAAGAQGDAHGVECIVADDERYASWLFSFSKKSAQEETKEPDYEVILPEDYNTARASYPVVYVMPNDGLGNFSDTVFERIDSALGSTAMDMIVVKVKFDKDDDPYSEVEKIIGEVDDRYKTLKDPRFRAVIGEEVGGYLAHVLTYTNGSQKFQSNPGLFGLMASINGDYAGEANMWIEKYGNVLSISKLNNSTALKFYTYLSAASEDERAYRENGANSVIKYFIQNASAYGGLFTLYFGNADEYSQNFSIKNGVFDENFEKKSVDEAIKGINRRITQNLVTGSLTLTPQSALESVEEIEASYRLQVSDTYSTFYGTKSKMDVSIALINPDNSQVLETVSVGEFEVGAGLVEGTVAIPNRVENVSTSVALVATLKGTSFAVDTQDLVRVLKTGTAPEDQVIDFMGVWKVKPIADASFKKSDWINQDGTLALGDYNSWADGTPCITWWNGTNGVDRNFVGYAWYVREFDIPEDFVVGTYQMPIGYLDEGDITFINGVKIGSTGMTEDTWKFESDQWDTYRSYEVSSDILNFGGKNYVAVLAHNRSGDGGWYKGHPGLYSQAAYNKLNSTPSILADSNPAKLVEKAVETQIKAVSKGDLEKYAQTVSGAYFQSGTDKSKLLETVKSYGKAVITDAEAAVYKAGDDLYLYQARRTIKTEDGSTLQLEVNDYFRVEKNKALLYGEHDRFYTQYIDSPYRAAAMNGDGNESFLVYLPEGYFDEANADKRYPVAYIFHQINSSSNSWKIDGINEFLDAGISAGLIKNTILVIPDSQPESWWQGEWVDMVTEDIIPFIDENYRTVKDARFRFTVGASMGGSGSYNIGLRNPDLFSGIISYFGAINMGAKPLDIAKAQYNKGYLDYLAYYGQYFVCGNQDLYKFGMPAIELDALLRNVKIDHYFELEEGAHDSTFYKPYVVDSFSYMTARIPSASANEAESVLKVDLKNASVSKGSAKATVTVAVNDSVKEYLTTIPVSDFTKNTNPDLAVPVTLRLVDNNGVTVARNSRTSYVNSSANLSFDFELSGYGISKNEQYTLVASANLFDYPAVASVTLPGKKAVIPPRPSEENNIAPSEETSASEAMVSYESGASGSGKTLENAEVLGAVKAAGNEKAKGASGSASGRKNSSSSANASAAENTENASDEDNKGAVSENDASAAGAINEDNASDEKVVLDKTADELASQEESATAKSVDIEENAVPLSNTPAQGSVNVGVILAIIIAAAILAAVGVVAVRGRKQ